MLAFSCEGRTNFAINHVIHLKCNNEIIYYKLKGVVYYKSLEGHFVCRIIDKDGNIYVHDGMHNNGCTTPEVLDFHNIDWSLCLTGIASAAIYFKSDGALCEMCALNLPCHCT